MRVKFASELMNSEKGPFLAIKSISGDKESIYGFTRAGPVGRSP